MPPPKLAGGEHSVFGSLVRPLSVNTYFLWHDVYFLQGFHWNLSQLFIVWVEIAERVFKVRSQSQGHNKAKCIFLSERCHSTYGRPSVVRPADAYRSPSRLTWLHGCVLGTQIFNYVYAFVTIIIIVVPQEVKILGVKNKLEWLRVGVVLIWESLVKEW